MKYFLLVFIFVMVVLAFFKLNIHEEELLENTNISTLPQANENSSLDIENDDKMLEVTALNPKVEYVENSVTLIGNISTQEVDPYLDIAGEMIDAKILGVNSDLYKKLLDDYKKKSFLAKEVSDTEFVIARIHPKGDVIFTLYNSNMVKFARENPEGYFQIAQQNFSELNDKGGAASENGYAFLDALYKVSRSLNIDIVSTYCNDSKCYFEAIFTSSIDADNLLAQLEKNSKFHAVIMAVFSIRENSFVATAYLN